MVPVSSLLSEYAKSNANSIFSLASLYPAAAAYDSKTLNNSKIAGNFFGGLTLN